MQVTELTEIGDAVASKDTGRIIRITTPVAKRLETRGKFGQTFSDVIEEVLNILDELEKKE